MRHIVMLVTGALVAVVGLLWAGAEVVNQDEIALRYRWGILDEAPLDPGFRILWPGHGLLVFDNTRHSISVQEIEPDEKVAGVAAQTKDRYTTGVVVKLEYMLDRNRAVAILREYGRHDSEKTRARIEARIRADIESAIRHSVPQFTMDELIRDRGPLVEMVLFHLGPTSAPVPKSLASRSLLSRGKNGSVSDLGIVVSPLNLSLSVPKDYKDNVDEARRKEYLQALAANRLLELELAQKQLEVDRIAAESRALRVRSSELGIIVNKWSGDLPSTLVLSEDGLTELRRMLSPELGAQTQTAQNITRAAPVARQVTSQGAAKGK